MTPDTHTLMTNNIHTYSVFDDPNSVVEEPELQVYNDPGLEGAGYHDDDPT